MANQVGPYTFTQWRGYMQRRHRDIAALAGYPGTSGKVIVAGKWNVPVVEIITSLEVAMDPASASVFADQYDDIVDNLLPQVVIDQYGRRYPNVLALFVDPTITMAGSPTRSRIDLRWIFDQETIEP